MVSFFSGTQKQWLKNVFVLFFIQMKVDRDQRLFVVVFWTDLTGVFRTVELFYKMVNCLIKCVLNSWDHSKIIEKKKGISVNFYSQNKIYSQARAQADSCLT